MNQKLTYGVALMVLLVLPMYVYPVFLMKVLCFALFACAFNLLIGYTGLLSFGHATFFGGAGYFTGYALKHLNLPFELGVLLGVMGAAMLGLAMGVLAIRRQGIYFTMITLALSQMMFFIFLQAPFTGGEDGLQGVPRGHLVGQLGLDNDMVLYYVVLAITIAGFALIVRTIHSPFGQVIRVIKENEPRAISLGYDVNRYKLLAFVLSAAVAGLAGSIKTVVLGLETLTDVHWAMSGTVVLMALVGGLGTLLGPIVGAVVIVSLENRLGEIGRFLANISGIESLSTMDQSITTVIGFIFVACVLAFRRGLVGELAPLFKRLRVRIANGLSSG
ncbi:branched-chain amino acid ABC transporter permease [Alcaligenaceae bacterium CGII-47]|nr:branched-chain amino acid ABC transporter permease [Alcaligenaceae bacterium CGII-47]